MFDPHIVRAVIFDIGGTLLDFSGPESATHLKEGAARAHAWLTRHDLIRVGRPTYQKRIVRRFVRAYLWSRVVRKEMNTTANIRLAHESMGAQLDDQELDRVARLLYEPIRRLGVADPQTASALATLRNRGYRLAVISNTVAPPQGLDDHLSDHNLLDLLPIRIYSCQVGVPKPNPRIFHAALDKLKLQAADTVYVGDKPRIDVAGARRVGMQTILRYNGTSRPPKGPKADHQVQRIADLLDILPSKGA